MMRSDYDGSAKLLCVDKSFRISCLGVGHIETIRISSDVCVNAQLSLTRMMKRASLGGENAERDGRGGTGNTPSVSFLLARRRLHVRFVEVEEKSHSLSPLHENYHSRGDSSQQ
jgi:hypothetical protein